MSYELKLPQWQNVSRGNTLSHTISFIMSQALRKTSKALQNIIFFGKVIKRLLCFYDNMNKKIIFKQKELKFYIKAFLIFLLFTFIVALPIGVYFFQNMEDLTGRTNQVSVFETENPVQALIKSATLHLGILFILGLAISIKKLFQAFKEKNFLVMTSHGIIFPWFFIMLAAGILTTEGISHSLRIISVIPPLYIFPALGGYEIYASLKRKSRENLLLFRHSSFLLPYLYVNLINTFLNGVSIRKLKKHSLFNMLKSETTLTRYRKKLISM